MGVLSARLRTVVVNKAIVVTIEERAGRRFQYIIAIFVYAQILPNEITGLHAKCFRGTLDVIGIKNRTGGLAAIGALQAIHFLEYLFMHTMEVGIHATDVLLFQRQEEFSVFLFFML